MEENPDFVVIKVDLRNAHNEVSRASIIEELEAEQTLTHLAHSGYRRYLNHQGNEKTTGGTVEAAAKPWLIPAGKYFAAHRPQGQHPP